MHRYLKAKLLASVLALSGVPIVLAPTATEAAVSISIGFNYFHDNLSNYGDWVYSDRWGRVWRPDVDADFRPYTQGRWVYTDDYGWYWQSDEPYGDITYHYGRWVNDPYDGWLWIPGYVWSPAWVVWRSNGNYTGWMPMPPTEAFLEGDETNYDVSDDYDYGYRRWYPDYSGTNYASLWIFVGNRHLSDRNYRHYAIGRPRVGSFIRQTRNVTNYTVVNNYVVNRSISVKAITRSGGRVERVAASAVIKRPDLVIRADRGREIQAQMRREAPHGTGRPDSAPKPTLQQIQTLSPTIRTRGNRPTNLLTRTKAQEQQAPNAERPDRQKPADASKPNAMTPETAPSPKPQDRTGGERLRGRDRNNPVNEAKPGEAKPNEAKPEVAKPDVAKPNGAVPAPANPAENTGRDNERRNNMRRMNGLPAENATPQKPAVETPKPVERPMRDETLQHKEVPAAPEPAKPQLPPPAANPPDRSQMNDQMRERAQERARARETVQPPPTAAPAREQATPATPPPATAEPRQIQREEPAARERRGNRDENSDKAKEDKKKDSGKDKQPD